MGNDVAGIRAQLKCACWGTAAGMMSGKEVCSIEKNCKVVFSSVETLVNSGRDCQNFQKRS